MTKNASEQHTHEDEQDPNMVPNEGAESGADDDGDLGDVEAQARRMGWKPQVEYKGDKSKWVDAAEFVRQAEEDAPALRKTVHQLQRHVAKTERGVQQIIAHQARMAAEERKRGYEQAIADLDVKLDKAVEDGDTVAARKITKSKSELVRQQVAEEARPAEPQDDGPGEDDRTVLSAWMEKNPWYNDDFRKTEAANKYEDFLARKGTPLEKRLKMTTEYIEQEFGGGSDEGNPPPSSRRSAPAMMGRGGHRAPRQKAQPGSYEALNAQGKADCDAFVKSMAVHGQKEADARKQWLRYASSDAFVQ